MKGKAALPAGSKTRAIWTPARPPPAWHVPRAATRRATWEADGTERTSLWVPSIAVGVVGGTGSCHGAHLDRLLRQEQRLLPLCQLQADGSGVTPCSRGTVLAALVPPGQETKHRDGDQPLVQRDGGPRSNPLCSSWAHPAPLHPRARGCPSAETPRNGTAAPALTQPQWGSPACSPLLCSSPSSSLSSTAVTIEQFGRDLPTSQSPRALQGWPKVTEGVVQMLCLCTMADLGHQSPLWEASPTTGPQ